LLKTIQRRWPCCIGRNLIWVVDEIFNSRNFAKYLFRISRNNLFISRNFVSRKVTTFREMSLSTTDLFHMSPAFYLYNGKSSSILVKHWFFQHVLLYWTLYTAISIYFTATVMPAFISYSCANYRYTYTILSKIFLHIKFV
jgi:hypothetical protein